MISAVRATNTTYVALTMNKDDLISFLYEQGSCSTKPAESICYKKTYMANLFKATLCECEEPINMLFG